MSEGVPPSYPVIHLESISKEQANYQAYISSMSTQSKESGDWGLDEQKRDEGREKLRLYFAGLPNEHQTKGWDEMWQQRNTPWDRHQPNPALVDTLSNKAELLGPPFKEVDGKQVRKKALVPGCGRGYDVLLFSCHGYDAYGLDASPTAIDGAWKLFMEQAKEQHYPVKNVQNGRGDVKFVLADFFKDDFLYQIHAHGELQPRGFDIVYDYTFLCALPPSMRPQWSARMSELLSPTGRLICLEYPLTKDPKLGGPPHGLTHELYEQLFNKPGAEVNYNLSGHVCEERSGEKTDNALVRVDTWRPERTFETMKGKDMVSVWRHWKS